MALIELKGLHHQLPKSSWQQGATIDLSGGLPVAPVVDVGEVVAVELLPEAAKQTIKPESQLSQGTYSFSPAGPRV